MTDQIWNAVASGGAISVIFAFGLAFIWKWWTKREAKREEYWETEVQRVRSTGEKIISQKDELLAKKDEDLKKLAKTYDERIASIVKTYDVKIKEKDDLLNSIREEVQALLIEDTTVKTRLTDSITNLVQIIQNR